VTIGFSCTLGGVCSILGTLPFAAHPVIASDNINARYFKS
jgi:hypothetical protein